MSANSDVGVSCSANDANHAEIRRALEVLHEPGSVIELRAFKHKQCTISGYYDDLDALSRDAVRINSSAGNVYITLNQLDPALLARSANRSSHYANTTTSDQHILRRRWLPVDLDPVRPSGISSSEEEHAAARALSRQIYRYLVNELGFAKPVVADSGNGMHLLFRIDLPNDAASTDLVRGCLQALAAQFSNGQVTVDSGNYNAARIWKLYGTVAVKGDSTADRPHRLAKLLHVPDQLRPVPGRRRASSENNRAR